MGWPVDYCLPNEPREEVESLATLFGMMAMGLAMYNDLRRFERSSRPPAMAMKMLPTAQLILNDKGLEEHKTEERLG